MLKTFFGRACLLVGTSMQVLSLAATVPALAQDATIAAETHEESDHGSDDHGGGCEDGCGDDHDDDHDDDHVHDDDHGDRGKGPKYRGGRGIVAGTGGSRHSLEDRVLRNPGNL